MDLRRIDLTPRPLERAPWWWIPRRARRALITIAFLIPIVAIAVVLLPGSGPGGSDTQHSARASWVTPSRADSNDEVGHPLTSPTTTTSTTPSTTTTTVAPSVPAVTSPPPTAPPAPAPPPQQAVDSSSAAAWAASPGVACIRNAESGDDYSLDTGNGYYGAYQDLLSTWEAAGGTGLPSDAPPAVQDQINYQIWLSGGWGQWSTAASCGL